jgi:ABC-type dipeptide/oligopeptide/nickel transport system permease subunit
MAATDLQRAYEAEGWAAPARLGMLEGASTGLARFLRRKPLGAACGFIVLFFVIVGDLVPETANKAFAVSGLADEPVPYLADQLADQVSFIYPYDLQNLRGRLQGSSSEHILGTDQLGRDIFSRLLYGARTAVMVSFGAVFISAVLQVIISVPAGYYGGWISGS